MPAHRVLPSDYLLQRMVEQGMTHQQIADKISKDTGHRVGRSAVSAALSRAGLTDRKRYTDTIPWRVKLAHQNNATIWMLRIGHRMANGGRVSASELERFTAWKAKLDAADAVITYLPDTEEGFYWVRRQPGDHELIRPPKKSGAQLETVGSTPTVSS